MKMPPSVPTLTMVDSSGEKATFWMAPEWPCPIPKLGNNRSRSVMYYTYGCRQLHYFCRACPQIPSNPLPNPHTKKVLIPKKNPSFIYIYISLSCNPHHHYTFQSILRTSSSSLPPPNQYFHFSSVNASSSAISLPLPPIQASTTASAQASNPPLPCPQSM